MQWVLIALGGVIATACVAVVIMRLQESRRPRVLCLMYHRLATRDRYDKLQGSERLYTVIAEEFDRQIQWLKDRQFAFVQPDRVAAFATGEASLPDPSVLITFDDGCRSVVELARPILERHGACATLFVTCDPDAYIFKLGDSGDGRCSDDALRAADGPALRIESHAITHRPLTSLNDAELTEELVESRRRLEALVSRPIEFISAPGNWIDRRVIEAAKQAGYRAMWSSRPGATRRGCSPYLLPRINVEGTLTPVQFEVNISPRGIIQRRLVTGVKRNAARLLGPRIWYPMRNWVLKHVPGGHLSTRRLMGVFAVLAVAIVAILFVVLR